MALPRLDVNVVLFSPMFMDNFIVVRRGDGIDESGRTIVVEQQIATTGVIHPSGINTQERPSDYGTGRKSIACYTQFRLRPKSDGFQPDLILYRGDDYLVQTVEDFTQFGRGFVQAYATSQDMQDAPPQEQ